MNANELKIKLDACADMLAQILSQELGEIRVKDDWSSIPETTAHVQFLLEQVLGVSNNLEDLEAPSTALEKANDEAVG